MSTTTKPTARELASEFIRGIVHPTMPLDKWAYHLTTRPGKHSAGLIDKLTDLLEQHAGAAIAEFCLSGEVYDRTPEPEKPEARESGLVHVYTEDTRKDNQ